jgi:hypothetical protein
MTTNLYAPPKAQVADIVQGEAAPALWNPGAAASWSLLLSPAFGAFLHMKNWGWAQPLLVAVGAIVGFVIVVGAITVVGAVLLRRT